MPSPRCPDCKVPMEEGWIPDVTHGSIRQSHWHKGAAERTKLFGLEVAGMKAEDYNMMPMEAWRCPDCGLVRTYAF